MRTEKVASNVADRFKRAFLSIKIPVNYALVLNCKRILEGYNLSNEMLVDILARYLDLVIYGICNDTSPTKEDLLKIAAEVASEYEAISENEYSEDYDEYDEGERF